MSTSENTQPTRTLTDLSDLGNAVENISVVEQVQPQRDAFGRSYATGKRKNAIARVWIKPGSGKVEVNGKDITVYFARPVLRMIINQAFLVSERLEQFDVYCTVVGGGLSGQATGEKSPRYFSLQTPLVFHPLRPSNPCYRNRAECYSPAKCDRVSRWPSL